MNTNKRILPVGLALVLTMVLVLQVLFIQPHAIYAADSDIVISEVMYNSYCEGSSGTDYTCGGGTIETQYEWVEIYNKGTASVNINNWSICDSGGCDTIGNYIIGPGEYWIISQVEAGLQAEITNGNYGSYDASKSVFLGTSIGNNGLSNTNDAVYLLNASSQATDCIQWGTTTTCTSLTYAPGGDGASYSSAELDGQSITNIQGVWYYHNSNGNGYASPYGPNIASGGSPSATRLVSLQSVTRIPVVFMLILGSLLALGVIWRGRSKM